MLLVYLGMCYVLLMNSIVLCIVIVSRLLSVIDIEKNYKLLIIIIINCKYIV